MYLLLFKRVYWIAEDGKCELQKRIFITHLLNTLYVQYFILHSNESNLQPPSSCYRVLNSINLIYMYKSNIIHGNNIQKLKYFSCTNLCLNCTFKCTHKEQGITKSCTFQSNVCTDRTHN